MTFSRRITVRRYRSKKYTFHVAAFRFLR